MRTEEVARELLRDLSEIHRTQFSLVGRCPGGEYGAFVVTDPRGNRFVIKWRQDPNWVTQIEHATLITDRLRRAGCPAPRYVLSGVTGDGITFWLQTELPGQPLGALTATHVPRLLELNNLQAVRVVAEQNWQAMIFGTVFEDRDGWSNTLKRHSPDTAHLASAVTHWVAGLEGSRCEGNDVVHGDFTASNLLADGGEITGIVDWEAAGRGDRAFDLACLLFYEYETEDVRDALEARLLELTSLETAKVYLVHMILRQVNWSIRHHTIDAVERFARLSRTVIQQFGRRTPRRGLRAR